MPILNGGEKVLESSMRQRSVRKAKVYKNRDYLSSKIIPEELPHREQEFNQVWSNLEYVLEGSTPSNLIIFGPPGSGKTVTVRKVMEEIKHEADREGIDVVISYTVAEKTEMTTLVSICEDMGVIVPKRGLSFFEVKKKLHEYLLGRKAVVIIDEIDKLIRPGSNTDLLYFLTRDPNICVVGISNVVTLLDNIIDMRVKSSWNPRKIVFEPYTADQLFDILKYRANKAFFSGVVDDDILSYIAAIAVKRGGDTRYALDILMMAGDLVKQHGESKIEIRHIQKVIDELEREFLVKTVKSLSPPEKALLYVVTQAKRNGKQLRPEEAYTLANVVLSFISRQSLSHRRWSDYRGSLELLGYIGHVREGLGRGRGWHHYLKVNNTIDTHIVYETLEQEFKEFVGDADYDKMCRKVLDGIARSSSRW